MKGKVRYIIAAAVLAAAAYAAYALLLGAKKDQIVYMTQPVTIGSITTTVSATGKLSAVEMVDVGSQVSGRIVEIFVDYNSEVAQGDLLAILDPDVLTSQVESAKAALAVAQAGVATANANLREARRNHDRNRELWDRQLIARSELDSTETSLAVANASLAEARARVTQSQESLKQAQTNLNYARITSPIDGVVVSKAVEVGQTVAASFNTPTLFSIAKDLTQMQIEANIDEADIGSIKAGQIANVTFDTWPDERFTATVSQIRLSPTTVSNVVTYTVILSISNADLRLLPGMTANLNIITEDRQDVVRIPAAALRFSPPAEVLASLGGTQKSEDQAQRGGLISMPMRRPGRESRTAEAGNRVWVIEDGKIARAIEIDETGASDRTWIEARGSAAQELKDGMELAVAFTKGAEAGR